jgi:hypothetical protein
VSEDVNVLINVDLSEAEIELIEFENEINKKASLWQRVKTQMMTESRLMMRSLIATVNTARAILSALNISLGPVGDAMLQMGMAIINSVIAMQYAYAAGGPIGWAMIGLSVAALAAALSAQVQAANGVEEARRAGQRAETIMSNISAILSPWR